MKFREIARKVRHHCDGPRIRPRDERGIDAVLLGYDVDEWGPWRGRVHLNVHGCCGDVDGLGFTWRDALLDLGRNLSKGSYLQTKGGAKGWRARRPKSSRAWLAK